MPTSINQTLQPSSLLRSSLCRFDPFHIQRKPAILPSITFYRPVFVYQSIGISISPMAYSFWCNPTFLSSSIHPSIYRSSQPAIQPAIYPYIHLSSCPSIHLLNHFPNYHFSNFVSLSVSRLCWIRRNVRLSVSECPAICLSVLQTR